jgi:hypothetical protein
LRVNAPFSGSPHVNADGCLSPAHRCIGHARVCASPRRWRVSCPAAALILPPAWPPLLIERVKRADRRNERIPFLGWPSNTCRAHLVDDVNWRRRINYALSIIVEPLCLVAVWSTREPYQPNGPPGSPKTAATCTPISKTRPRPPIGMGMPGKNDEQ